MADKPIRVTIWNEGRHEKKNQRVASIYPDGMHGAIREGLEQQLGKAVKVKTVTLDDKQQGITDKLLAETDVMLWWGHGYHAEIEDANVEKVKNRVHEGMGLIVLHSGHYSKIFKSLMGTGCGLKWREAAELERLWVVNPAHPIVDGLGEYFELPHTEMYGEFFDIPQPDELVLVSWFEGGDIFRSGCCWTRGKGKVFYFRPGHETFPIYFDENVRKVIANGVRYVAPRAGSPYAKAAPNIKTPLSPIRSTHKVDESLHR